MSLAALHSMIDSYSICAQVDKLRSIDNYSIVVAEMDRFCVDEVST